MHVFYNHHSQRNSTFTDSQPKYWMFWAATRQARQSFSSLLQSVSGHFFGGNVSLLYSVYELLLLINICMHVHILINCMSHAKLRTYVYSFYSDQLLN